MHFSHSLMLPGYVKALHNPDIDPKKSTRHVWHGCGEWQIKNVLDPS